VGGRDGLHDGESETESLAVAGAGGAEPLERLEELLDGVRWHDGAGVGDGEHGVTVHGLGGDLDSAVGCVVPECVVHEVGDEAFGEGPVARCQCCGDRRLDRHGPVVRFGSAGVDGLLGELCQVEGVADLDARVAAGQGEECLDKPFLLGACGEDPFVSCPQGFGGGVGVG
jgi:hypothetical protein